jgi:hypothetical protein
MSIRAMSNQALENTILMILSKDGKLLWHLTIPRIGKQSMSLKIKNTRKQLYQIWV